jgi:hypothetical protein
MVRNSDQSGRSAIFKKGEFSSGSKLVSAASRVELALKVTARGLLIGFRR